MSRQDLRNRPSFPLTLLICAISALCVFVPLSFLQGHTSLSPARDFQPSVFVHANDRFGFDLLESVALSNAGKNIVVSPLPVSIDFAAIASVSADFESNGEIGKVFHWTEGYNIEAGAKMLAGRFAKPAPPKRDAEQSDTTPRGYRVPLPKRPPPEVVWMSNGLVTRERKPYSTRMSESLSRDFGFQIRTVRSNATPSEIVGSDWDPRLPRPTRFAERDLWMASTIHLLSTWDGNTFVYSKPEKADFHTSITSSVPADFLKSEFYSYPHLRNEDFEAAELTTTLATLLLIQPANDKTVPEVIQILRKNPELIDTLRPELGDVRIPPFHLQTEVELSSSLIGLGVHRIFKDNSSGRSDSYDRSFFTVREMPQKTELAVDKYGIRADSGTLSGEIYGGIMGGSQAFHLVLDRPFLFLIRDRVTGALLFTGIVNNPLMK